MPMAGLVLSTMKLALEPERGARLPATSRAVPAAMEIVRVPLPLMALMVTVRVAPMPLSTLTVPVAVPVLARVILAAVRLLVLKLVSV